MRPPKECGGGFNEPGGVMHRAPAALMEVASAQVVAVRVSPAASERRRGVRAHGGGGV